MRTCFAITSYCDTPKKVDDLKKCITGLKRFDIDILIVAHYPLDLEIQKSVKYYIYDSSNPVISDGSKVIIRWIRLGDRLLTIRTPDYSFAVMNLWIKSLTFLKNDYDNIHIINYDIEITDFIFGNHQLQLNEHNMVFEGGDDLAVDFDGKHYDKKLISAVFFSIKNTFVDTFLLELTLEKYMLSINNMLEGYMKEFVENLINIKILYHTSHITNVSENIFTGFELLRMSNCTVFGGVNQKLNMFEIVFYDIINPINEIVINIDGNIFKANHINSYYSFKSPFSMNYIYKLIDENKLSITIDDEIVNNDIIQSIKNQSIKQD